MRVLALSSALPFPPVGGGKLRSYHLLKSLATRHQVTQLGFHFNKVGPPDFPVELIPVPWEQPPLYRQMHSTDPVAVERAYQELTRHPEPWFASYYESPAMAAKVAEVAGRGFDLILIEGTAMGRFLPQLPEQTPKILNLFDLHTLMAQRAQPPHDFERTQRFESNIARQCVAALACSRQEVQAARELLGITNVHVVPNGVDLTGIPTEPAAGVPGRIVFTGMMNYEPNARAVEWFVREVMPRLPGFQFHVIGAHPPPAIEALAGPDVIIHGFVPDVRPYVAGAEIVVAPLLDGGGTRLKIIEAAAHGKPIVATTLGAEGLDIELIRAEQPEDFAAAILALHVDPKRRQELETKARQDALPYDWTRIGQEFCKILEYSVR